MSSRSFPAFLRWPGLHFFLLGGLLYSLRGLIPAAPIEPSPIVLSETRLERLRQEMAEAQGRPPTADQLAAAIQQAVDHELLERQARRLGLGGGDRTIRQRLIGKMRAVVDDPALDDDELHRMALDLGFDDDVVVRRLLRQKMRLLLQRHSGDAPASEEDLAEALERHRERFLRPAAISFRHVFISSAVHVGEGPGGRAKQLAAEIRRRRLDPDDAVTLSDPFPLALRARHQGRVDVARRFGEAFAEQVMELPEGAWSEPLESPYGLHLVWIDARHPERLPALDGVREPLLRLLEEERAASRLADGLDQLRQQQPIVIDWPEDMVALTP